MSRGVRSESRRLRDTRPVQRQVPGHSEREGELPLDVRRRRAHDGCVREKCLMVRQMLCTKRPRLYRRGSFWAGPGGLAWRSGSKRTRSPKLIWPTVDHWCLPLYVLSWHTVGYVCCITRQWKPSSGAFAGEPTVVPSACTTTTLVAERRRFRDCAHGFSSDQVGPLAEVRGGSALTSRSDRSVASPNPTSQRRRTRRLASWGDKPAVELDGRVPRAA